MKKESENTKEALQGLKILDLSWVAAGPLATQLLAMHGAEVINVERPEVGDHYGRQLFPYADNKPGINRSAFFNNSHKNKYGITLDFVHPKGRDVLRKLIARCDVVLENFSAGAMERLRFGYEDLKRIKKDIIMVRLASQGQTGPHSKYVSFGPVLQSASGFNNIIGWPDRPPTGFSLPYADFTGTFFGVMAILQALIYRNSTGESVYIDMSQLQTISIALSSMLDYTVNGRQAVRTGNQLTNRYAAPHGVYRCLGDDEWCAITVFTEEEWHSLCHVMGDPDWTKDVRFSTILGRMDNVEVMDRYINSWTCNYSGHALTEKLQLAGVSAGIVANGRDLLEKDQQLAFQNYWVRLDHPEIDEYTYTGVPFKLSETPGKVKRRSPLLGEDNEYVYKELLSLTEEQLADLYVEKVI